MAYPRFSEIIKHFAPGWFAAVMGTGVLAMVSHGLAWHWPLLGKLAKGLHQFNLALFAVLLLPWCLRWLMFPQQAWQALKHPVQANFYPTLSIALLVLAAQAHAFGLSSSVVLGFWCAGVALHFLFSFAVLFFMFNGEQVAVDHVTPANFIPAVGLVVMPLAGGQVMDVLTGELRTLVAVINAIGLGAGGMMYIALLGLTMHRKFLHKPVRGPLTPTLWIHLAPIGVIPVSLLNLADRLPWNSAHETAALLMLLVWGFGVWWLLMALLLTVAAWRAGQLPFALSWWAFTFPLGAFASAGLRLNALLSWSPVLAIAVFAWGLLCCFWLLTLVRTLKGVVNGSLWVPHG